MKMKTQLKFKMHGLITLLFIGFLMGCQDLSETENNLDLENKGKGTVVIKMTDAPFPSSLVAEANVTIDWIKLYRNTADEMEEEGDGENEEEMENDLSVVLVEFDEPLTFNLLELSNGVTATLAEVDVSAGTYHEIRMHVIDAGIILNDGTEFDLKVPGGSASGLKIKINPPLEIDGGSFAEVLLDFDVSRSFVMRGNINHLGKGKINGFIFKPVIRAVAHVQTTTGEISGTVTDFTDTPVEDALLTLIADGDTVTSSITSEEGNFVMIGIPAGDYSLVCAKEGYVSQDSSLSVAAGQTTEQNFVLVPEDEEEEEGQ